MRNTPLATLTGAVAPLLRANIDTDAIAPSRVRQSVDASDLSGLLFRKWCFDADGTELPDFVLNRPERRDSVFMVALDDFGCGSSREMAPWASRDHGICCVVAPSFGSIFNANCSRNGVAPVVLSRELVEQLGEAVERDPGLRLTLDVPAQTITATNGFSASFPMDPGLKQMLVEGLDSIGLTLIRRADIDAFRGRNRIAPPWVYATAG